MDRPAQLVRYVYLALAAVAISACGSGGGGSPGRRSVSSGPPVTEVAPGGGGRNFYVGVQGACPPAGYPAATACFASLDDVPWGTTNGSGHTRLTAGDTVYISYDSSPYHVKFQVSGEGTPEQWIRVQGILGPLGERPVIDGRGATTARFSEFRATVHPYLEQLQGAGVLHIGAALGDPRNAKYIEIANLEVYGARAANTFVAEDGGTYNYGTAGGATPGNPMGAIYARSVRDVLIRNNVLRDSAEGFYDWTGAAAGDDPDGGASYRITLRGNIIHDVGVVGLERRHATYTEVAGGMIYEFNYFGPMTPGALGNQLRDRSAGTIVRYNWFDAAPAAYELDLMEPEESAATIIADPLYAHDFVYGNVFVNRFSASGDIDGALVHWSENNAITTGRTEVVGGVMHFYHNTILIVADYQGDWETPILVNWAEQADCPATARPALNDVRNNLVVLLRQTPGTDVPPFFWERCGDANMRIGVNWVTSNTAPQWYESNAPAPLTGAIATPPGLDSVIAGSGNPFVDQANGDLRLAAGAATVLGAGEALHADVTSNVWGMDFTPIYQIVGVSPTAVQVEERAQSGAGADLGALGQ